jgi:outer membrane protein assembly factor BamB
VAGGTVYVGSDHNVYALDAATGHPRWTYLTRGYVESSPAVAKGAVYIGSNDGEVYALDAATGRVRWAYATGGFVDSSPAVARGIVYIGSADGKVYALDAATGHVRWAYSTGSGGYSAAGFEGYSSPAVAGGIVYIDGYALYAETPQPGPSRHLCFGGATDCIPRRPA